MGNLKFILVNDEQIKEINSEFLEHDYTTDVISFDFESDEGITGEIYIGCETVRRNAELFNVTVREELCRVIVHGLLHLLGYDDKSEEEKKRMKDMEDYYLGKI